MLIFCFFFVSREIIFTVQEVKAIKIYIYFRLQCCCLIIFCILCHSACRFALADAATCAATLRCGLAFNCPRLARPAALSRWPRWPVPQPFIMHIYLDYTIIHLTQTSPPRSSFSSSARSLGHFIFSPPPNDRRAFGVFYQARGRGRSPREFFLQISLLFPFFSFLFSSFSSLLFLLRLYFAACRRQLIFFPAQPGLCMVSRPAGPGGHGSGIFLFATINRNQTVSILYGSHTEHAPSYVRDFVSSHMHL